MKKDFEKWNSKKQFIEKNHRLVFAHPREIWWCSVGTNIGAEIDRKNHNFERPVIVMKVYNKETLFILPLTTREKKDDFHYQIKTGDKIAWVKLTQGRVISNKRLLRKIEVLDENSFESLKNIWKDSL